MTDDRASGNTWRERLRRFASDIGGDVQRASDAIRNRLRDDQFQIIAYRGYGNSRRVLVHGRALELENIPTSTDSDSAWRNFVNTYKRIESDPLRNARIQARIGTVEQELTADDEGFFRAWIDLPEPLPSDLAWHPVQLRLLSPLRPDQPDVQTTGLILVPHEGATFGVISDIDDTVIQSRIASFFQAVRTVMLGNARTRLPFPGVAAFYQALERGGDGERRNPIIYVSSSPWNIYDIIAEFLELQKIPIGPICLRDWDVDAGALSAKRLKTHKEPLIREILDLFPNLPFLLIGDTSQKDPEIYRAIIDSYPKRIAAVYIRNVEPDPERSSAVQALAAQVLEAGSVLVLADDSYAAAMHAAEHGWITKDSLPAVREEKKADEGTSGTKAEVPGVSQEPPAPTIVVE